jgi:type II secretory pathway component PulF
VILIDAVIVLLLVAAVFFVLWIAPRWYNSTRLWLDQRIFPFTLLASLSGVRLLVSIASYVQAGIPIVDAIENIRQTSRRYMASHCNHILMRMRRGDRVENALVQLSIIPKRYHWIISVYGLSQEISHIYTQLAAEMMEMTKRYIESLFDGIVNNVMLAMIGGVIFWIYSSMFAIVNSGTSGL